VDAQRGRAAALRPTEREWTLYSADSNSRWHEYDFIGPSTDVRVLLGEIDDDPTSIFWG
jgi:hypothetical protein